MVVMLLFSPPGFAQEVSIRPLIGGLPAESGFAAGVELRRTHALGPVNVRAKGIVSVKKYQLWELASEIPELGPRWLYFEVAGRYRNYPEEDFWGLGPDTNQNNRTNFLIEDFGLAGTIGGKIGKARAELSYGFLKINTGPGRDQRFPSIPDQFQAQPRYRLIGSSVEYDSLDEESDPHAGGKYAFRWTAYKSAFQRYEVDLRHFVPLGAEGRIGLRVQTIFTEPASNREIPFFMLPTVGGVDTVRGFHQYRFRDRNALVLNAEYRRPLVSFIDAVVFTDVGRVFSRPGGPALNDIAVSPGTGARFRLGKTLLFGVDMGVSREGALLWFRSEHMF